MNDETRKLLTEYLGECVGANNLSLWMCRCSKKHTYRTFTTPDDMMALKDKLVEKREWIAFKTFTYQRWSSQKQGTMDAKIQGWEDWLINAPRFCELVGEWLEKRKEKP